MKKPVIYAVAVGLLVSLPASVGALSPAGQFAVCRTGLSNFFGIQPWYACLPVSDDGSPRITGLNDIFLIAFPLVESLVKIGALVAAGVIFFLLAQMIMARGDSGKIANAAGGIRDAVVGFVILLVAVAIVNFISGAFVTVT